MSFPELEGFASECEAIEATLADIGADAWSDPGLGEWTVAELVAHLVRGVSRIDAYLDEPVAGDAAAYDRITYWQFDLAAEAPAVARRARQEAATVATEAWADRFAAGWRRSAERAGAETPDRLISALRGPMRLDEYTATRALEAVVHHMDLRAALGQPPVPTEAGATLTVGILEGLLGEPKPRAMGRSRFIKVATGRLPTEDSRFPVLR